MNARAAELGCTGTNFTNTHGLPDANHYTTAWDFSRIVREAAKHELFMTIASTINYTVPDTNVSSERVLESTNSLVNPTNPLYPGDWGYEYAKGIKTGHTNDAGYCLASSAEKDGVKLLSVVLKSEAYQQDDGSWYYGNFADTRTLFEWGFNNFSYQDVLKSTETVTEVPVAMGADADTVTARPSTTIRAFLPNDVDLTAVERTITLLAGHRRGRADRAGQRGTGRRARSAWIRDGRGARHLAARHDYLGRSLARGVHEGSAPRNAAHAGRHSRVLGAGAALCRVHFRCGALPLEAPRVPEAAWSSRAPSGSIWRTTRKSWRA